MAAKPFKAVIVGGSVAGLALACMFERNGIDFVVLEGYRDIAPQVGASIGVLPNGMRVLDQLGLYETILAKAEYPVDYVALRDIRGKPLTQIGHVTDHLIQRYGYPMAFFERKMLIQILYERIADKSKVLTSKRVVSVENKKDRVSVVTQDGMVFEGDIVVGADGVHSTIRRTIWSGRASADSSPERPTKEEDLSATYGCLFGIATNVPQIRKGSFQVACNKGSSVAVASGPSNKTYFTLFFDMGKTYHGAEVPRFSKVDEEEVAKKYGDCYITEDLKFSDLYSSKITTVLTPVHEYVNGSWHHQRCITVGDSSHKFNPLSGQGGNSAIESAAMLTNELVKMIKMHGNASAAITVEALSAAFERVQEKRTPRAYRLMKSSEKFQLLSAMDSAPIRFIRHYVVPTLDEGTILEQLEDECPNAVSLDMIPTPKRPRAIPYDDELARLPKGRSLLHWSSAVLGLGTFAAVGYYYLQYVPDVNGTLPLIDKAAAVGSLPEMDVLLRSFSSLDLVPGLPSTLKALVAVFMGVISGVCNFAHKLQANYFILGIYLPLLTMVTVEAHRIRSRWTALRRPYIWLALAQLIALGVMMPIYFLASFFHTRDLRSWAPPSRRISIQASRAILPAVLLGFVIPTLAALVADGRSLASQPVFAFWSVAPLVAFGLTDLYCFIMPDQVTKSPEEHGDEKLKSQSSEPQATSAVKQYQNRDLPQLKLTYIVIGVISALVHVCTVLFFAFSSSGPWFTRTFLPPALDSSLLTPIPSATDGMFLFLQLDLLVVVPTMLFWAALSVWDLHRVGLSRKPVAETLAAYAAGCVLVGPGAATLALWSWREDSMAGLHL